MSLVVSRDKYIICRKNLGRCTNISFDSGPVPKIGCRENERGGGREESIEDEIRR